MTKLSYSGLDFRPITLLRGFDDRPADTATLLTPSASPTPTTSSSRNGCARSSSGGQHDALNNFIWAYNVDTGKLARVLSCPAGAEATGLQAVDDLNGFMYIMSNFQHAGDWDKGLHDKVKAGVAPLIDKQYRNRRAAAVGYIHGLPRTA